jgi:hypothetical protein
MCSVILWQNSMKIQHEKYDFDLDYCHFNYMTILKTKPIHSCHFTMAANYHYLKDYKSLRWWWWEQEKGIKDVMLSAGLRKLNVNEILRQEWVGASCFWINPSYALYLISAYSHISTYGVALGSGNYDYADHGKGQLEGKTRSSTTFCNWQHSISLADLTSSRIH